MLEEAVLALPKELPFEQVDRIEYMNEQRRAQTHTGSWKGIFHSTPKLRRTRHRGVLRPPRPSPPPPPASARPLMGAIPAKVSTLTEASPAWQPPPLPSPVARFNLTLVTQTDMKRLGYLAECASRWLHPLIAALLLPPGLSLGSALSGRSFGSHVTILPVVSEGSNSSYPINQLRNTALRQVTTTHFLVLDVDLWPSSRLYETVVSASPVLLQRKYAALVVPAFQYDLEYPRDGNDAKASRFYRDSFQRLPSNAQRLRACMDAHLCSTFYSHSSPETHSSTPYDQWWKAPEGSEELPILCFKSPRYEPYVVLPNQPSTPFYSEQFTGEMSRGALRSPPPSTHHASPLVNRGCLLMPRLRQEQDRDGHALAVCRVQVLWASWCVCGSHATPKVHREDLVGDGSSQTPHGPVVQAARHEPHPTLQAPAHAQLQHRPASMICGIGGSATALSAFRHSLRGAMSLRVREKREGSVGRACQPEPRGEATAIRSGGSPSVGVLCV